MISRSRGTRRYAGPIHNAHDSERTGAHGAIMCMGDHLEQHLGRELCYEKNAAGSDSVSAARGSFTRPSG